MIAPALERMPVRPARFDTPKLEQLDTQDAARLLSDGLRLSLRRGAGPFRSAAHLGVEPRAYQLVPLMMALKLTTVLFCGDQVLLDAGEPIYYLGSYADFVGPSFSKRHTDLPSRGDNREWIAHRGAAYGIEEIEKMIADCAVPPDFERASGRIESLVERHRIDGAALACARALIRHLVWKALLPSVHGARLRQRFAHLFSELGDQEGIDEGLCRRILIEMTSAVPREARKDLNWEVEVAGNVLKRLERLSPPALDEKDDEALGALGF